MYFVKYFCFFSKLLRLQIKVTECTNEQQKYPKKSEIA